MPSSRLALTLRASLRWAGMGVLWLASQSASVPPAAAIEFRFDYTYDTAGFFGTDAAPSPARAALEFASRAFTPFADSLAPIQPGGGDNWVALVRHPSTGGQISLPNLVVETGVITVFAGSRNLPDSALAEAGRGIYSFPSGRVPSAAFVDAIVNRGQGDGNTDFAPWGGFIEFDRTAPGGGARKWHFDHRTAPASDAFDFHTVAVHELAHLLGHGTSTPFVAQVDQGAFGGPTASGLYGRPVPLHTDNQHWGLTVTSPSHADAVKPSLAPEIAPGERRIFTPLDYAAMADIGWQVTPEQLRLPGDVDGDHFVDGRDFLIWQRNFGGFGGSPGDVDGNLRVDDYDGWLLRQSLGASAPSPVRTGVADVPVPEPSALQLLAVAMLLRACRAGSHSERSEESSVTSDPSLRSG